MWLVAEPLNEDFLSEVVGPRFFCHSDLCSNDFGFIMQIDLKS